jgi:hypothetical protein
VSTENPNGPDTDNVQEGDQTGPDVHEGDQTGPDTDNVQEGDQTGPDTVQGGTTK